jgi:hypothetical protein
MNIIAQSRIARTGYEDSINDHQDLTEYIEHMARCVAQVHEIRNTDLTNILRQHETRS